MKSVKSCLALLTLLLLSGSFPVMAKSNKPEIPAPVTTSVGWAEGQVPLKGRISTVLATHFPDKQWWERFQDPQLTGYISAALQGNPSLNIALARVAEARALARESFSQELPSVNLNPGAVRLGLPNNVGGSNFPSSLALFNLPLQASYELDVWGKNLDKLKAARKQTESSEFDSRTVLNTITGEVASAYINLLRMDGLIGAQQENLQLLQRIERLKESQNQIGLITLDEVLRAKRDVLQAKSNLVTYQQQQASFAHQLSILTGSPPAAATNLQRGSLEVMTLPQETAAGMPSELITRRPDILAQERLLQKSRFDVQVARKAFLPSFNLSAMLGLGAGNIGKVFDWDNLFSMVSGTIGQPLFKGGQLKARLDYSKARQKEQLESYRLTILNALKDVEDSLSMLRSGYEHLDNSTERLSLTEHDLKLVSNLYKQGLVPHMNVLQTQSELIQYRQSVIQSKADTAVAIVSLYKALGGGF